MDETERQELKKIAGKIYAGAKGLKEVCGNCPNSSQFYKGAITPLGLIRQGCHNLYDFIKEGKDTEHLIGEVGQDG